MIAILKAGKDKFLRRGYPWVFRNLVDRVEGSPVSGDLVKVADAKGHVFGQGFFHSDSQIMVRFVTTDPDAVVDENFLRER
ncbi:MAG: class I SAM-dependent rRNA methyltransferase, partial [Rhodothermales bacterium]|nr:class I SAM-dependent rRNA methyltransferase [Rhodothermales bacterium]